MRKLCQHSTSKSHSHLLPACSGRRLRTSAFGCFCSAPVTPAALLEAGSDDDDDDEDIDALVMRNSSVTDAAAIADALDAPLSDADSSRSSVLTDAAYVVAQFHERLSAARSGSFAAVNNQYLDDDVRTDGQVKPSVVLYRAMRDALPLPEDFDDDDDLDGKWDEDEEMKASCLMRRCVNCAHRKDC